MNKKYEEALKRIEELEIFNKYLRENLERYQREIAKQSEDIKKWQTMLCEANEDIKKFKIEDTKSALIAAQKYGAKSLAETLIGMMNEREYQGISFRQAVFTDRDIEEILEKYGVDVD